MNYHSDHLPEGISQGSVVAGKYRIDRIIGSGAMGVVVAARHLLLEDRVAIKFLLPQALESRASVTRFMQEARAAVRIKSEHVARVYDVGLLDGGTPYIVMEFLEGRDLAEWLVRRGPLPIPQAVELLLQACEAIAEAHSLGVVHRDLKPANLYVVQRVDGVLAVKVLDFGISKTTGGIGGDGGITDTQTVMGSPSYMSPEQMESARSVDFLTDIWALGAILFELVTGKVPYDGKSLPQVYAQIVSQAQPSLRDTAPVLPPELEAVVLKCLQRNRALRYRNIGELAFALAPFAPRRAQASIDRIARMYGASSPEIVESTPPASAPAPHTLNLADKTLSSQRQTGASTHLARGIVGASIAVVLFVAGALGVKWTALAGRSARPPVPSAAASPIAIPVLAPTTATMPANAPPAGALPTSAGPTLAIPVNALPAGAGPTLAIPANAAPAIGSTGAPPETPSPQGAAANARRSSSPADSTPSALHASVLGPAARSPTGLAASSARPPPATTPSAASGTRPPVSASPTDDITQLLSDPK